MRSTAILPAALELDPRVRKSRLEPRLRQLEPGGVVRGCLERFERLRGGAHPLLEKTQSRPENCGIEPREMVASLSRARRSASAARPSSISTRARAMSVSNTTRKEWFFCQNER